MFDDPKSRFDRVKNGVLGNKRRFFADADLPRLRGQAYSSVSIQTTMPNIKRNFEGMFGRVQEDFSSSVCFIIKM